MRRKQTNKQNLETERKKLKTRESEGGCGEKRQNVKRQIQAQRDKYQSSQSPRNLASGSKRENPSLSPSKKLHNTIERNDPRLLKLVVGGHISLSGVGSEAAHFIFLTPCGEGDPVPFHSLATRQPNVFCSEEHISERQRYFKSFILQGLMMSLHTSFSHNQFPSRRVISSVGRGM